MIKKIAILGSTGSIGKNALRVIEALGPQYKICALSAHSNVELLAEQTKKYKPQFVAVTNPDFTTEFNELTSNQDIEIFSGPQGLIEIAKLDEIDIILAAVVGSAGLPAPCRDRRRRPASGASAKR